MSGDHLDLDAIKRPFRWLTAHESTRTWREIGPRWQVILLRLTLVWIIAGSAGFLALAHMGA